MTRILIVFSLTVFCAFAPQVPPQRILWGNQVQQQVYKALSRAENCLKWLNPGCLKYARQLGAVRGPHWYAVFIKLQFGQEALWRRIQAGRGQTVLEFLSGYNPGIANYPFRVAAMTGLDLEGIL
jgi:hypothetical protein